MNEESAYASRKAVPATLYERQVLLAFMPPSQRQRRMAFACVLVLSVIFFITAPFISTPLPQIIAFIPIIETAVFICALITASLLFAQYAVSRAPELLALASGYLFTALIVIPHALTFPGRICTDGPPRRGSQSTAWLYIVWHSGFALFVIGYALLKDVDRESGQYQGLDSGCHWLDRCDCDRPGMRTNLGNHHTRKASAKSYWRRPSFSTSGRRYMSE